MLIQIILVWHLIQKDGTIHLILPSQHHQVRAIRLWTGGWYFDNRELLGNQFLQQIWKAFFSIFGLFGYSHSLLISVYFPIYAKKKCPITMLFKSDSNAVRVLNFKPQTRRLNAGSLVHFEKNYQTYLINSPCNF